MGINVRFLRLDMVKYVIANEMKLFFLKWQIYIYF